MIQGSSRWEVGNGMRGAALAGQVAEAVGWLVGWRRDVGAERASI